MINVQLNETTNKAYLTITGAFNIFQIEQDRDKLLEAIDLCRNLELNLTQLQEIDLSGIQLILSLHRTIVREHKQLTLHGNIPQIWHDAIINAGFRNSIEQENDPGLWRGDNR